MYVIKHNINIKDTLRTGKGSINIKKINIEIIIIISLVSFNPDSKQELELADNSRILRMYSD